MLVYLKVITVGPGVFDFIFLETEDQNVNFKIIGRAYPPLK